MAVPSPLARRSRTASTVRRSRTTFTPHLAVASLTRHLRTIPKTDLLIGLGVVALGTLEAFTVATEYGAAETPELWWIGQAVVTGALVWFRRKTPVAVFILMILAQYVWHRQGYEHCQTWQLASLLIVFHTVAAELPLKPGLAWAVTGILVFDSGAVDHRWLPFDEVIFLTVVFGAAYLTGLAVHAYAARAERLAAHAVQLERDRERQAAEAVAQERVRIARELHDVVAHSVSMMVMQAGVLRRTGGGDEEMLLGIEQMGREAVDELRVMLGALRMPLDEAIPQPGLDLLSGTVSMLVSSGLEITFDVVGEPVRLPPGLDLSAYRIVQEALTNAVKHANESRIQITITYHADRVELEILDGGGGAPSELSTGNGLVGMRERAALFGGRFEAGPRPEGGFRVHASLPISHQEVFADERTK
ncbi:sensor histidine kinase [Streptosporangium carneum]|uniref:histidine kinase n=1 Tax=Streptosporangium carneum TaxID=47481 RepID=A0A9W6MDX8_9ACTN|nr:sensor histidine kinase [Streptosporangium carneum]GLK10288.1 two-component sensor histidine kinase [Streptosporangium carneum]